MVHLAIPSPAQDADSAALLEQLAAGVALLDGESRFVYANASFCALFDVGTTRLRGLPLEVLGAPESTLMHVVARARAESTPITMREQTLVTRSGRPVCADIAVIPWRSDGVLIEAHELTLDRSGAGPSRQSATLRGFAHEVKNPLAGVRGAAQLLKRRLMEPELVRLADLVISEADRLGALADRLLHAGGKPHFTTLNLHEVSERARALVAAEAEPGLKLGRDYDPSLPTLRGDGDRLLQLVFNLMRNAMQAQAKSILVRTRAERNVLIGEQPVRIAIRLDVIDDGDGVAEELRQVLFQPLVSGRAGGTGLGLALAQEIAHEHGGLISYRSVPGQTTFSLLLPLGGEHG